MKLAGKRDEMHHSEILTSKIIQYHANSCVSLLVFPSGVIVGATVTKTVLATSLLLAAWLLSTINATGSIPIGPRKSGLSDNSRLIIVIVLISRLILVLTDLIEKISVFNPPGYKAPVIRGNIYQQENRF